MEFSPLVLEVNLTTYAQMRGLSLNGSGLPSITMVVRYPAGYTAFIILVPGLLGLGCVLLVLRAVHRQRQSI
jgi:hypothetical protein